MRAAVFVLSAAVLAYEICLLRVMAIAHYSHASPLVVSVALLGFGAGGVLLAVVPALRRSATVAAGGALFAMAVPASFHLAARVDFNVLEVGWDAAQWLRLLAWQGIFLLPFLSAGLAIATALLLWAKQAGAMYAANLLGSGLGALLAPLLLSGRPPEALAASFALAAALGCAFVPGRAAKGWAVLGLATVLALGAPGLPMSPFKYLQAAPGRRILETCYSARGRVDLAEVAGLHHAPGLSLVSTARLPRQDAVFVDGHLAAVRDRGPSAYLEDTVGALPFVVLSPEPRVLVLGVGPDLPRGGTVVEADADLLRLSGAAGQVGSPRAFLRCDTRTWDLALLHVSPREPLHETPLLTVDGLGAALARIDEHGCLAIGTDLEVPPRPGLTLLATAERVTPHLVAVRSMDRLCVLLRHRPTTAGEWERIDAFCARCGFDVVRPLARRPVDPYHQTGTPLLAPGRDYPFDVRPATDARPYFHRHFRWSRLGDVLDPDAVPFVQWGFVAVFVAFLQVVLLGVLLLLVPLFVSRAARAPALLFLLLGVGYMLLEMAFLSTAVVRTGAPTLAAATVIGSFLVGSGVGALAAEHWDRPLRVAALSVGVLALPAMYVLPNHLGGIALVCGALAVPMGMPFPAALRRLSRASVPWALAVNGCASVGAAAGAPLLSSTFSIPVTVLAAGALYVLVSALGPPRQQGSSSPAGMVKA